MRMHPKSEMAIGRWKGGFTWPPGCRQVLGWLSVSLLSAVFFVFERNSADPLVLIPCYSLLLAAVVSAGVMCTALDPSRPRKLHEAKEQVLCKLCNTLVAFSTKHCRICNRCIIGFDHHCNWLNTCIAEANYRWFVALVVSLEGLSVLQVVCGVLKLVQLSSEEKHGMVWSLEVVCIGTAQLYLCAVVASLAFLLYFHLKLKLVSMTTYEYYMHKQIKTARVSPFKYASPLPDPNKPPAQLESSLASKNTSRAINNSQDLGDSSLFGSS